MLSKLADQTIKQWWEEGLKPTVEDIITLNNLGMQIERSSDCLDFSVMPRTIFLGDVILREMTIIKRVWFDEAVKLFDNSMEYRIYLLCYTFGTSPDELPSLSKPNEIKKQIEDFRDKYLLNYTESQILTIVDYLLNGNEPDYSKYTEDENKENESVFDLPEGGRSIARQILFQACSCGIDSKIIEKALPKDLERMLLVSAMDKGVNVIKNNHAQAVGNFYMISGKIYNRLKDEVNRG